MITKIKGKFKRIIYSSSNFNVLAFKISPNQNNEKESLSISETNNSINVILKENDVDLLLDYELEIKKVIKNNSKYPINYFVESKKIILNDDKESTIRFLSSSLFKGISTKTATKVVDKFGKDFISNAEKLEKELISLIGKNKSLIILNGLKNNSEMNEISSIFIKENFSISILNIIKKISNENIREFLENQIFTLIEKHSEINFLDIDKIAKHFYKSYSQKISDTYLVLSEILKTENDGSTINDIKKIFSRVNQYRLIEIDYFKSLLKILFEENKIVIHREINSITSTQMFEKEKFISNKLVEMSNKENSYKIDKNNMIFGCLDDLQQKAIIEALTSSFYIITGGPGTGKTLLIDLIMKNLKKMNVKKIELLAPTGKAATQISYRTNESSRTFHSFLKWNGEEFEVNEKKPSNVEVVIVDEFSMININLFYSLLISCPKLKHLIIVGDKDQLPSIGPGYLLNDFMVSKKFKMCELEKIYRQSEGSLIAKNSKLIKNDTLPYFDNFESTLIEASENSNIKNLVLKNLESFLDENKDILDYQILIPMYGNEFGIDNINVWIQEHLNVGNQVLFSVNKNKYFKGDKIIQLENDSEKNIFNGEIGKIYDVIFDEVGEIEKIKIKFDEKRIIEYTLSEFNRDIKLAYAISIHKFQGSECSWVLLIFLDEHSSMFSKKLFYTAYTRARKKVAIISTKENIEKCIGNDIDSDRKCNILNLLNNL